ncbi:MAG: MBL fold metallo-hydrolase [Pseudomonadota bacterium]
MNRRTLLKLSIAMGTSLALPDMVRSVSAKEVAKGNGLEIVTVSDGYLRLPLSFIFPDIAQEDLTETLGDIIVEGEFVENALNLTLMRSENRLVLFDAGSGPNFMPSAGDLTDNLDAIGIAPDEITDVVFTHAHPDHLWGILDDFDDVLFSEADLHISRAEFDFWRDPKTLDLMPEARKPFAVGAKNRLDAISEQVKLFEPGAEIFAGVEAVDTSGHTPGHMSFVIHGAGDPVMVLGDALTNSIISFEKPELPSGTDHDPEKGIKTRKVLLDRLGADAMQFVGYHLPNEGVGRVEKTAKGYRFSPS